MWLLLQYNKFALQLLRQVEKMRARRYLPSGSYCCAPKDLFGNFCLVANTATEQKFFTLLLAKPLDSTPYRFAVHIILFARIFGGGARIANR